MDRNDKMSRYREWDLSCKVYVGNLGSAASKHEIESIFNKYGPLRNVWVARNPPGKSSPIGFYRVLDIQHLYLNFRFCVCGI